MIADLRALQEIRSAWNGVEALRERIQVGLFASVTTGIIGGVYVVLMERGEVLETIEHPNQNKYPGQKIATVRIGDHAYLVPYVKENETIFLKTIIPSRKATNKHVR